MLTSKLEEQIKAEEQLAARRGKSHRCNLHSCRTRLTVWRRQQFGSPNNGNCLGLFELVAKFDSFLLAHINRSGNSRSENSSYLSKTICEEMIQLMAKKVKESFMADLKKKRDILACLWIPLPIFHIPIS